MSPPQTDHAAAAVMIPVNASEVSVVNLKLAQVIGSEHTEKHALSQSLKNVKS
jgi:hypothetical protein